MPLASAAVLLLALTACGAGDSASDGPTGPHAEPTSAGPTSAGPTSAGPTSAGPTSAGPTSAGECDDLPLVGSDGGMVLGTDWSGETHPYEQPVDLTVCVTPAGGGRVRVRSSDTGITVTPGSQRVPGTGTGLLTVQVRVASGTPSGATLRVEQYGGGIVGDTSGPAVVTTTDGWHFDRP